MPQPKIIALADNVASGGGDLPLVKGGDPPSEFRLFQRGENPTTKGALVWTEQSCADALAWYESTGRKRLSADWEHDSLLPAAERSPKGAPASAWWELAIRDGEPWAVNVAWTADAFQQLAAGEYAHFSPVVLFDPETRVIRAITKFALTNDPATIGQGQLIAASDPAPVLPASAPTPTPAAPPAAQTRSKPMKMNPEALQKLLQILQGEYESEEEMMKSLRAALAECAPKMMEGMAAEMKQAAMAEMKPEEKRPEEMAQMTALSQLRGSVLSLSGKATDGEALAVLTAWRESSARVEALTAENTTLKREKTERELNGVVEQAVLSGKVSPAERDDATKGPGAYIAACKKSGDVLALTAFVEALPAKVAAAETKQPETKAAKVDLTAEEIALTRSFGNDPAVVADLLAKRRAEQAAAK